MKKYTEYFFNLHASYNECLRLYDGSKQHVILIDDQGVKVSLPLHNMKPFITRLGIKGRFRLRISPANKIIEFVRIS